MSTLLVTVDARINGVPATLVLDTGSAMCALDAEWASGLGLGVSTTSGHAVGTDRMRISLATIDSLRLGDSVELRDEPAALVPLREVSQSLGRTVHGTLGYGFFTKYVVKVDYASRVIGLHDPATFAYDGLGERIAIDLSRRVPILRAEFVANGTVIPTRLILDLGTDSFDALFTKAFADHHVEALTAGPCTEQLIGTGVGGSAHGRVTSLDEMRLGALRVPNPSIAMPADSRGFFGVTWVDGALGAATLSRTRLILDYPHEQVIILAVDAMPGAAADSGRRRVRSPGLDGSDSFGVCTWGPG